MIPHKLIIKNFLSYGETPAVVNFDPYNLICLSGKNGNGKSALLDALTWAIWGQARKISGISKPDEGLLRLGASRMLVTIEFSFNNQYYRIRREYARAANKAIASLDLEIRQPSHGFFSSLTDKTIRATQDKINQLLGIDYETFVNSSFIRQGHSNEFSKKSPKERKEILGSILGLDHYQQLQSAALDAGRQLQVEQQMLERIDALARQEIEQHADNQQALELSQKEAQIRTDLTALKTKDQELSKEFNLLEVTVLQQKTLQEKAKHEAQEITTLQKKINLHYQAFKLLHAELLKEKKDKGQTERKKRLETESALFLAAQQKNNLLQKELEQTQLEVQTLQEQIEKTKKELREKILPLQQKETQLATEQLHFSTQKERLAGQLLTLKKQSEALKQSSLELEKQTADHATFEALFDKRKQFYQFLQQKNQLIDSSLSELQPKKEQLEIGTSAHCPLCDQLVTAARKKFLQNKLLKDQKQFLYQKNKIIRLMKSLKELLIAQHKILQEKIEFKKQLEQNKTKQTESAQLIVQIEKEQLHIDQEITARKTTLEQLLKEVSALKKELEREPQELLALKAKTDAIKQQIKTLNYHAEAHNALNKELTSLYQLTSPEAIEKKKTEKALKKAEVLHLISLLKKMYQEHALMTKQLNEHPSLEPLVLKKQSDKKELERQLDQRQKELEKIVAEQARIASELLRIKKIEAEMKTRAQKKEELSLEIQEYQLIAQAFSKNGIPALLIEEVIPELENEANQLLQKLTNNQAQIFIESVRDLKKGGVKETLDIHISDSSGIRPYEMFSGGEAFRIDFALRIAISKLLARRAGTPLQTLIIDEGFGSQDEEGLQKIMDALYKIQNDFAKIIIVSHLPMMKDNFPVHFIIEKGALGSQVTIEERG
jgi:exonuclease SbcC